MNARQIDLLSKLERFMTDTRTDIDDIKTMLNEKRGRPAVGIRW